MDMFTILAIFVVVLLSIFYLRGRQQNGYVVGKILPGPKPLPFVGSSMSVDFYHLHLSLGDMVAKYGYLFQIKLMGQTAVVISDPKLMKKAFSGDEYADAFNGRAPSFFGKYFSFNCKGLVFANSNKRTMTMRKMFHRGIKLYGDGVDHFETISADEFKRFLDDIANTKARDFDIYPLIRKTVANSNVNLMTGKTPQDIDHKIVWQFIDPGNIMIDSGVAFIFDMMPWLRLLPGKFGNLYRKAIKARDTFVDRYYFTAKRSLSNPDEAGEPGLLKTFFRLRDEENQKNGSDFLDEENMKAVFVDLLFASTETSTAALTNSFALLIVYPDVAKRIQEESDRVVGKGRMPKLADRKHMPYTMATVYEVLRYTTAQGPMSVPHLVMEDKEFEGYHIPKNSVILPNHFYMHHDPRSWKDPWRFQPERFLDAEGNLLPAEHETRQNFIGFGVGRRDCVGERLGKSRMFLYIAYVMQSYDIIPGESEELPDTYPKNYIPGINLRVKNFKCRAIPRL